MLNTLRENYFVECDELTVFNWARALRGQLQYMRRDVKVGNEANDTLAWRYFLNDYLENIEESPRQESIRIISRRYKDAILAYLTEPEGSPMKDALLNDVKFAENDYNMIVQENSDSPHMHIFQNIEAMSDIKKRTLDPKNTTVLQYLINIKKSAKNEQQSN